MTALRMAALAVIALPMLAACSSPSARYGLEPPSTDRSAYPNINVPPGKPQTEALPPEQRAAEQARVAQQGTRPATPAP